MGTQHVCADENMCVNGCCVKKWYFFKNLIFGELWWTKCGCFWFHYNVEYCKHTKLFKHEFFWNNTFHHGTSLLWKLTHSVCSHTLQYENGSGHMYVMFVWSHIILWDPLNANQMQKDSTNRNDSKRTTTFFCNSFVPFQVRSSGIDDERVVLQDHYVSECQHPFLSLSSFSSGDGLLLCSLCFFLDLQRRAGMWASPSMQVCHGNYGGFSWFLVGSFGACCGRSVVNFFYVCPVEKLRFGTNLLGRKKISKDLLHVFW